MKVSNFSLLGTFRRIEDDHANRRRRGLESVALHDNRNDRRQRNHLMGFAAQSLLAAINHHVANKMQKYRRAVYTRWSLLGGRRHRGIRPHFLFRGHAFPSFLSSQLTRPVVEEGAHY